MMVLLLIAGIAFLLAGVLTIGFGIPVKEFSFGNTLILTGTVAACTGLIMLGLWTVVRELKNIARRLGPGGGVGGAWTNPELLQNRRCAVPAKRPRAIDLYRSKRRSNRRRAPGASRAQGGSAAGHGPQIGRG